MVLAGLLGLILLAAAWWGFQRWREAQERWLQRAEEYRIFAQEEKEWILSCQTDGGLILLREWEKEHTQEEQTVVPYFSSIAALGLLSGTVTEEQAEGARRYQLWYLDHLNSEDDDPVNGSGTIYDYRAIRDGRTIRVESAGSCDSVDSYAALFLILADRYASVADQTVLQERSGDIVLVIDALMRTIDESGLSYAKAEYPVQYLMDNSEVYAGLCAAAEILEVIEPGGERLERVKGASRDLLSAMERILWNQEKQWYEVGAKDGEVLESDGWSEFYPDSVSQLFPACFGVLEPSSERGTQLYESFSQTWEWETLEHRREEVSDFYWCVAGYAAALQGDSPRLDTFMERYRLALEQEGREYPLYTGEAGWMAMACGHMEETCLDKVWLWK